MLGTAVLNDRARGASVRGTRQSTASQSWHHRICVITALLMVAGCGGIRTGNPDLTVIGGDSRLVPPGQELLLLTGIPVPPIIQTQEEEFTGALAQRTVFANNTLTIGENYFRLQVNFSGFDLLGLTSQNRPAPMRRYTAERIEETLAEEFAGLDPTVSSELRRNQYGLYSHAVAIELLNFNCVLAWQVVERGLRDRVLPREIDSFSAEMRICDSNFSPENLLFIFDNYRLRFATGAVPR